MVLDLDINSSPVRKIIGRVELYDSSSTLLDIFSYLDKLISFTVERVGEESKFFGFGVCQKINVKVIDKDRQLNITTDNYLKAYLSTGDDNVTPFPRFYVSEVHRDENTNELSITGYDMLYKASGIIFNMAEYIEKLGEEFTNLSILDYAGVASINLGLGWRPLNVGGILYPMPPVDILGLPDNDTSFQTVYATGANLDGTETLKYVLDAIAEATQTIYYINNREVLIFKRLDKDGEAVLTIGKDDYFTLDSKTNKRLSKIAHITELGDNVQASLNVSGSTQYIRNNPFWDLRDDIGTLVNNALAASGGITINQFDCSWRGNYCLEYGDKINLITKDDATITAYIINDSIEYNGFLSQHTQWSYTDDTADTEESPATLGEVLKQTYARVDKANQQITLHAEEIETAKKNIAELELSAEQISLSVTNYQNVTNVAINGANNEIATLKKSVETKMTDEDVTIKINQALSNGVDKVETSTGFTFNEEGLTVDKSDSEMKTTITEDGMTVYKNNSAVLTANNQGVDAKNLHATTYLIIGANSRFEDYGNRTGCFWIGG